MSLLAARYDPDVEAALMRAYGVAPTDVSLRRMRVLLHRLRPGDWPVPDADGEPGTVDPAQARAQAAWSQEAQLLFEVIDVVRENTWLLNKINSTRELPEFKPWRRPWEKVKRMSVMDMMRSAGGAR